MIEDNIIDWSSKKQSKVALSSTEAEFYALTETVKEAIYLTQWFQVYFRYKIPITILCDNKGALLMSDHTTNHQRTKHIDIRNYFIRSSIKEYGIFTAFVPGSENVADILTKRLGPAKLAQLRSYCLQ
jgi:hypothetical protein